MRGIRQIYWHLRGWSHRVRFGNDFICGQKVILRATDFCENRGAAPILPAVNFPDEFRDSLKSFGAATAMEDGSFDYLHCKDALNKSRNYARAN
jgi:hypothetical protein